MRLINSGSAIKSVDNKFLSSKKTAKPPICLAAQSIKKIKIKSGASAKVKVKVYLKTRECLEDFLLFCEKHNLFSSPEELVGWLTQELSDRAMSGIGALQRSYLKTGEILVEVGIEEGARILHIPCSAAARTQHLT